jgi:hypothetical protein
MRVYGRSNFPPSRAVPLAIHSWLQLSAKLTRADHSKRVYKHGLLCMCSCLLHALRSNMDSLLSLDPCSATDRVVSNGQQRTRGRCCRVGSGEVDCRRHSRRRRRPPSLLPLPVSLLQLLRPSRCCSP